MVIKILLKKRLFNIGDILPHTARPFKKRKQGKKNRLLQKTKHLKRELINN